MNKNKVDTDNYYIFNPYIGITTDGNIEIFTIKKEQPLNLSEVVVFDKIYRNKKIGNQILPLIEKDYEIFKKLGINGERLSKLTNIYSNNNERIKKRTIFESIPVNNEKNYKTRIAIEESYENSEDNLKDCLEKGETRTILTNGQKVLVSTVRYRNVINEEYKEYKVNCTLESIYSVNSLEENNNNRMIFTYKECQSILNSIREKNKKNSKELTRTKIRSV